MIFVHEHCRSGGRLAQDQRTVLGAANPAGSCGPRYPGLAARRAAGHAATEQVSGQRPLDCRCERRLRGRGRGMNARTTSPVVDVVNIVPARG